MWLAPIMAMKRLFIVCAGLLLINILERRELFSITGRIVGSREHSVIPLQAFKVAHEALPNLERSRDSKRGFIDWENDRIHFDGIVWQNVKIKFNSAQASIDLRPWQVSTWVTIITQLMLSDPYHPMGFRDLFRMAAEVDQYLSPETFQQAWRQARKKVNEKDPTNPWLAKRGPL